MEITKEQRILINELREMCGCGLIDCRKAMIESDFNLKKAYSLIMSLNLERRI